MNKKTIKLITLHDLNDFVSKASIVEGDIIVSHGRYAVDGKSVMGMMSLDVSNGCIVEYPADATEVENFISKFEI